MPADLWQTYTQYYLQANHLTIEKIYDTEYPHCDGYMVTECLAEFDELFQKFCDHHMPLIYRRISRTRGRLPAQSFCRRFTGGDKA